MELKIKLLVILLTNSIASLCFAMGTNSPMETIQMYNVKNEVIEVIQTQQQIYEDMGWYLEPVIEMYAADGRKQYTIKSEVEIYKNLGWFLSEKEAKESTINQQELLLLAKAINSEAADNNYTDKCYVGAVIMNRVDSGIWGNTVYSVLTAKGQYACYGNSKFKLFPPQDCIDIAKELLLGERYGVPKNVIFQSGAPQGNRIWTVVRNTVGSDHYYCYGNI